MTSRRVLYVNRAGFVGGTERVLVTLASGVAAFGYEPTLACPGGGELEASARAAGVDVSEFAIDSMRVTLNPRRLWGYLLALRAGSNRLVEICRERRIDVIHAQHPVGALYAARAARLLRIPLVLHVHEALPANQLYRAGMRRAAKVADTYICVSAAARELIQVVTGRGSMTHVIPNGVNPSFLEAAPLPAADVTGPGPHLGVFGVIEPRKGQDVFLRAAELLAGRHPTAQFWIVGPLALKDRANYLDELKQLAASPALAGRVHFTGFRNDISALMCAMQVVALTSVSHESMGMVLAEALVLGRPTVASRTGGTHEVIDDGRTGFLVPPSDPGALADAIDLALGPEGARRAAIASEEAPRKFSPSVFREKVCAVYDELLAARPR